MTGLPAGSVAELSLHRGEAEVAHVGVRDELELTNVQIGSMFVAEDVAKAVLAPADGRSARVQADARTLDVAWEIATVRVPLARLSRWQWLKLLHAPMLRRVSLRLRSRAGRVQLRIRRR